MSRKKAQPGFIFVPEREVNKWGNLNGHLARNDQTSTSPYENVHLFGNHNSPGSAKGGQISRSSFQTGDDIVPRAPIVQRRWQLACAGSNTGSRTMQWGWSQHPMLVCFLLLLQFGLPSSPPVSAATLSVTGHSPWLLEHGGLHP